MRKMNWCWLIELTLLAVASSVNGLAPLIADNVTVDYFFVYKFAGAVYSKCDGVDSLQCIFGGIPDNFNWSTHGLQYVMNYRKDGKTVPFEFHSDCIGSGNDPVANTFRQIYKNPDVSYVIYNDQFYYTPEMKSRGCNPTYCDGPWAHAKGVIAWDSNGNGILLQTTTPDWPGAGIDRDPSNPFLANNTLGCDVADNNIMVAQHFMGIKLTAMDTLTILQTMRAININAFPDSPLVFQMAPNSPKNLVQAAKQLGTLVKTWEVQQGAFESVPSVKFIAKPSELHATPWLVVGSVLETPLRVASWFAPTLGPNSTHDGYTPGCWNETLKPAPEIQVALTGQFDGKTFPVYKSPNFDGSHAKLAVSLDKTKPIVITADMNQDGPLQPKSTGDCGGGQSSRGGFFFVFEDQQFFDDLSKLLTGQVSPYVTSNEKSSLRKQLLDKIKR